MGTVEKQGIVSILRSDSDLTKAPSLRKTLSADMSSKKWLAQNGFSPMKKIASSEEITNLVADSSSSSSDVEEDDCDGKKVPEQFDVWSSILVSKKADGELNSYVHPLVKRSKSALSVKSLAICTESLGSETGSDVFPSYASSETDDKEQVQPRQQKSQPQLDSSHYLDREELRFPKYNYSKKVSPNSFPPPLPSLARSDGSSLHMHSHRQNGRLVLEAMSITSQIYFHAQREDGHLVLTFANTPDSMEPKHEETIDQEEEKEEVIHHMEDQVEEMEEIFDTNGSEKHSDEEDEEEEDMVKVVNEDGAKEIELVMEQATKLPCGVINVHRSATMIKKLMEENRNPIWTNKYNKGVHIVDMEEEEGPNQLAQSLPRPPRMARLISSQPAAASSFNTYEYFWRAAKPAVVTAVNLPNKNSCSKNILYNSTLKTYQEQGMVLLKGNKADYLVPLLKGCKEPRRSLLIWEPYCIASS